jgi:drug/metabolite transporter (DMT)-like permease
MLGGGLILTGAGVLTGKIGAVLTLTGTQWVNLAVSTTLLFAFVLCYYGALKLIPASQAAAFLLLAPAISLLIGVAALGEPAPALQVIGSGVVLFGAYLLLPSQNQTVPA